MNQTIDIVFGRTPNLSFEPPQGRPTTTSAVEVFENSDGDDDTAEVATTGNTAVVTTPNTTISADSGVGEGDPRIVNLTTNTGIVVGRKYLLTAANGRSEIVEVVGLKDDDLAYARHPLQQSYINGDTFVATRIEVATLSAWMSDADNLSEWLNPNPRYRVKWEYEIDSRDWYTAYTYFDLVRWSAQTGVTGDDVDAACPGFIASLSYQYQFDRGLSLINEAMRQVKMDLYGEEKADQMIRNQEIFDDLVLHKSLVMAEMTKVSQGGGSADAVAAARGMYQERFNSLIRAKTVAPFAIDDGGAAVPVEAIRITRR